jgi:hypothetical protein
LKGGVSLYSYVSDTNGWVDMWGLLRRPYIRNSTRQQIEQTAVNDGHVEDGRYTDPNTGLPIPGGKRRPNSLAEGEYHLGHVTGHEHRTLEAWAEAQGMTQKEFNDYVNNHPEFFQIEDPLENMSHKHEAKEGEDTDSCP